MACVYEALFLRQKLLECAAEGDLKGVRKALEEGQTIEGLVDSEDAENGYTALHLACERGNMKLVQVLIEHGADCLVEDVLFKTCLHHACRHGERDILQYILSQTQLNLHGIFRSSKAKLTPLQTAAKYGHEEIVILLIDYGEEVDELNELGESSLHLVAKNGHGKAAKVLLENEASTHFETKVIGLTALHYACMAGSQEVAELLVENGADIHCVGLSCKKTPLCMARDAGFMAIANSISKISKSKRVVELNAAKRRLGTANLRVHQLEGVMEQLHIEQKQRRVQRKKEALWQERWELEESINRAKKVSTPEKVNDIN